MRRVCLCLLLLPLWAGCTEDGERPADDLFGRVRREIAAARRQPLPRGHVKVRITRYELARRASQRRAVFFRYRDRNLRVAAGALDRHGVTVFAARPGLRTALSSSTRTHEREQVTEQFLVLLAGHQASLDVVQVRPEPWLVVVPVWDGVALATTIRERVTGTGLHVAVHSASPQAVDLELLPFFHRADRHEGRLEVTELRTRLRVVPGRSYVIASQNTATSDFGSAFLTARSDERTREVVLLLRAEVGE